MGSEFQEFLSCNYHTLFSLFFYKHISIVSASQKLNVNESNYDTYRCIYFNKHMIMSLIDVVGITTTINLILLIIF